MVHFIDVPVVVAIHSAMLVDHGGLPGIKDEGALESTLARPVNLAAYGSPTIFEQAATLGYGLIKNHVFNDANKRTAFASMYVFLKINGYLLKAPQTEAVAMMVDVADNFKSEAELAAWLQANC